MVDLNTQWGFCSPDGACPVSNLVELIPSLRRVVAWTKRNCVPVVSAIDSHRSSEIEGNGSRVVCVDGSEAQRKIDFTILPQCARVEVDNTLSVPLDLFDRYQQVIFRERTEDLFSNPKADRFLTQMPVGEFVVFGNVLEGAVKAVALGLLKRAKSVTVVPDACGYWNRVAADLAVRQLIAKGANIVTVDELLAQKLVQHRRCRLSLIRGWSSNGESDNGNKRDNGRSRNRPRSPTTRIKRGTESIKDMPKHGGAAPTQ
jgi:nicotinamidase-related amidase